MIAEKLIVPLFRRGVRGLSFLHESKFIVSPHPVPDLPVLNELEQRAKNYIVRTQIKPEETAIVGAQHFLETTSTLFRSLRNIGFEVYATGKCYSTSPAVYESMKQLGVHAWPGSKPERLGEYQAACEKDVVTVLEALEQNPKIKKIIFCDDGGRFFEKMPPYYRKKYRVGGVEQTRAGFYSRNVEAARIPIVNVAQSAAKILFESPFIADATVEQISTITNQLDKEKCIVGIIGFGAIGRALADKLLKDGFQVAIFDKDAETYKNYPHLEEIEIIPSIEQLFMHTTFIIGCTGQDNTKDFDPLSLNGHDRIFASVSSEDKEYKTLLRKIAADSTRVKMEPLSTIECYTNHGNIIEILYGGFPINFAHSSTKPYNVSAPRIALTQGLLFSAIMQAIELVEKNKTLGIALTPTNVMLDPQIQQKVVELWCTTTIREDNLPHESLKRFLGYKDWVAENSKGFYFPSEICQTICSIPSPKPTPSLQMVK